MAATDIYKSLIVSLAMTVVLEMLISVLLGVRDRRDILLVCAVNIITNPPVVLGNLMWHQFIGRWTVVYVALAEVSAVLAEAVMYRGFGEKIKKPFKLSLLANSFSYFTGLLLNIVLA